MANYKLWTIASSMNETTGPVDYSTMVMTSGDDTIRVGGGDRNCWTYGSRGNLWNKNPYAGWVSVDTGAGNDKLVLGSSGNMLAYTKVDMGSGNDTYQVKGSIFGKTKVDMGTGSDTLSVNGCIKGDAFINTGTGSDQVTVKGSIVNCATVDLGQGKNSIHVYGDVLHSAKIISQGQPIETTADKADVIIDGTVGNCAKIILGDFNDSAIIHKLDNYASVDMGAGNDQLTVEASFGDWGCAKVDLGAGDDIFHYSGKTLSGVIDGGEGKDTLYLDYAKDDDLVSGFCAWKEITNLSSRNFNGIEVIEMTGMNVVDIQYKDLLADTTNEGALFIKGDSNDKVDLGACNWNSDDASRQNLKDNGGKWWSWGEKWSKTGSEIVDDVAYDVYHHSSAGGDLSNDVYIEQGVVVI